MATMTENEEDTADKTSGAPVTGGLRKKSIPAGLWTKCPNCQHVIFNKTLR